MACVMVKTMKDAITIDSAGRIVLPKPLRERFRLRAGSRLEIEIHDDHLTLRPLGQRPMLRDEGGWWVHRGDIDPGATLEDAVQRHRRERIEDLAR